MNAIPGPGTKGSARTIPTSKAAKPRNIRRCFDMPTPEGDLVRRWFQVCWPYLITSLSTSSVPDKCAPELAGCTALSERALHLISKSDCPMKRIAERVMSVEYLSRSILLRPPQPGGLEDREQEACSMPTRLPTKQVRDVPFVFQTNIIQQVRIQHNDLRHLDSPRPGIGLRIVNGQRDL
jgi:hypothetical protein